MIPPIGRFALWTHVALSSLLFIAVAPVTFAQSVHLELLAQGIKEPTYVTVAPGDDSRLFVLEKQGTIRIFERTSGSLIAEPFLSVPTFSASEAGLLGLAFAPDYVQSGVFYITHSLTTSGSLALARYRVTDGKPNVADPASREVLFAAPGSSALHAGGWIGFHPHTGHFFLTLGDGDGLIPGSSFPHVGNAQNRQLLRGKILRWEMPNTGLPRVPTDNPFLNGDAAPEIWALGVRNPWRASFDRLTADFWFGDVGNNTMEEINIEPAGTPGGRNYGWSSMEGTQPTGFDLPGLPAANSPSLIPPVFAYPDRDTNWGSAVIGGYVYRGSRLPDMAGKYLFGDYMKGRLWTLLRSPDGVRVERLSLQTAAGIEFGAVSSFGEDNAGELYVVDFTRGALFQIEPDLSERMPQIVDLNPSIGQSGHPAAQGLSFRATTQGINELSPPGFTLVLNGIDVSASLKFSGTSQDRSVTYEGLTPNQLYRGEIVVADQANRRSTNRVEFDTLVSDQIQAVPLAQYGSVEVTLPASNARMFLRLATNRRQWIKVERVTDGLASVLGVFPVPGTTGANTMELVPLTDVLGSQVVIGTGAGGVANLRVVPASPGDSVPAQLVVAPSTDAATARYVGFVTPTPDDAAAVPDSVLQAVLVSNEDTVLTASLRLQLDGLDLTERSEPFASGNTAGLRYQPSDFLSPGSQHEALLTYPTQGGETASVRWRFAAASFPTLNPNWATPVSSVANSARGFAGRIHKARNDAPEGLFPNSPERAADQLAGLLIDPDTGSPFVNEAAGEKGDGSFVEALSLNYEQNGVEKGLGGDRAFPNLGAADQDNIALEAIAYLNLPRGAHRLAVACDDGFVVWAGPSAAGTTNLVGVRSPGGGTAEVALDLLAEQAGVYAFRLVYFEANGPADLEWYSIDLITGERLLVNAEGGIPAYQTRVGDGADAVPPPAAVPLSVAHSGAGVTVSWPKTTPGFRLEVSETVDPAGWRTITEAFADDGKTFQYQQPPSATTLFYRLVYP